MIYIEPRGGLANRMRVIASALWLKHFSQKEINLIWNENPELNAPFPELFQPISELNIIQKDKKFQYYRPVLQSSLLSELYNGIINKFLGIDFSIIELDFENKVWTEKFDIVKLIERYQNIYIQSCEEFGNFLPEYKHLIPIPPIQDKINKVVVDFDEFTIGLHIRRTDHKKSIEHSPLNLFIEKIEEALKINPNTNFFLSTDDKNTENLLVKSFGNKIITHKKEFNRQSLKGIQDAVIDLYCLSKTNVIYGSYWSSFTDISGKIGKAKRLVLKK